MTDQHRREALRKAMLHRLRDEAVRNKLSVFAVVSENDGSGGNCTYSAPANNKHNEAVKLARRNHMAWEVAHGHDPHVGERTNKWEKQARDLKVRHRVEAFGLKNGKIYGGIYQDGQFGTFGGGLGNNSPEQAAREEYREEGGYILKNVRKIPMPPAHYVWGKADRAQAKRTGKYGRVKQFPDGMMTQYLVGDLGKKVKKAKGLEHDTGLKHIRFYTPDQALSHLPPVDKRTRIRRKVIEYIKTQSSFGSNQTSQKHHINEKRSQDLGIRVNKS